MSRRIEIEITSLSGDLATWRAAGAKLPKGVLAASLVPGGPVVGHVYRADIEQYMEGIEVLSVTDLRPHPPSILATREFS
jgi:S1-C subfamily serine protease